MAFKRFKSGVLAWSVAEDDNRLNSALVSTRKAFLDKGALTCVNDTLYKRGQHFGQLMLVSCVSRYLARRAASTCIFPKPFVVETHLFDDFPQIFLIFRSSKARFTRANHVDTSSGINFRILNAVAELFT